MKVLLRKNFKSFEGYINALSRQLNGAVVLLTEDEAYIVGSGAIYNVIVNRVGGIDIFTTDNISAE